MDAETGGLVPGWDGSHLLQVMKVAMCMRLNVPLAQGCLGAKDVEFSCMKHS
jgi:hypothetical protein